MKERMDRILEAENRMNRILQAENTMVKESLIQPLMLYLNNALFQSPTDISKTQKAIEFIKHYGSIGRFQGKAPQHGTHHMSIVLTNNSLSEASQWTVRLNNKLRNLNTIILSSKRDSDVRNLDQFWGRIMRLKNANDLPDLIVMCTHERRTADVIDLISTLKNKTYDLSKVGIHNITISIMFDEADKNAKLIVEFLKSIWPLLTFEDEMKDNIIRDIHFITATPLEMFWKQLKTAGITKLQNVNHAIQSMDETSVLHGDYKELMKQYRWLTDHNIDTHVSNMTTNPVEYASILLDKWGNHTPENSRIVFAPADIDRPSHYNMRDLFMSKGYWVYIDNSDKNKGKGFYNPQGKFQSLDSFKKEHNIHGEPYETFRKWRELYPTESLAITGWLTIIRGITFNTTGFNFTNMILSACHMKNLADLLQVAGRADGDKKYVGIFNIHCPHKLWETVRERVELMAELHEKNPSEFEEQDFRPQTKRDVMNVAMTVPCVIPITPDELQSIQRVGREYDKDKIVGVINTYNSELATELKGMEKKQISQPLQGPSIKKHITDFINAASENKKYTIDITKEEVNRKVNLYQIFIDKTADSPKLIVSIFKGQLLNN